MIIHFAKNFPFNNEPTKFVEKILFGIFNSPLKPILTTLVWNYPYQPNHLTPDENAKIHTIREDKHNRWKQGRPIHFMQWTGDPYHSKCFHFAPVIPCTSVQNININYLNDGEIHVCIDHNLIYSKLIGDTKIIEKLAIADGFNSVDDFFKWFDKDFKGKIIHWTDLKY